MQIYKEDKKQQFLTRTSIADLFSFQVEEYIEIHEYQRDEWIIKEGMRPDYLFFVMEGKAKIYVTHQNGKVSLINFINANDYIGEMELLHDVYYTKGIQASTKVICFALPFYYYRTKLLEDAKFLRELTRFLSEKATVMAAKYSQTLAFPLENRLADFILQTADDGIYKEKHVIVCDYLGVSYRHLLYMLTKFCEKQYLQKDGRNYQIKEYQSLRKLAEALKNK
ncbi:transcriptional regulator YeiL [Bacillus circulans]|uniref:transcriptional regulator YeiL n=1 Tax=Niallia circulans TaxID=1397 RepID=UPI000F450E20|nr:transcriptional regulator YeiL [Niallia circulans]AYV72976.1 transcriptional regulator YeiL [Niallia circulans]NRG25926.1 transcriptional regulator YeiL [Niallia circulans]QJX64537.1 transcriptional regulator YeiL [Niallia circulans]